MHVMELEPLTDPQGFNSKAKLALEPARVPAQAISALAQKQPKYPGLARAAHIQGEVMISAIISKEGAIAEMDAIASPHKMLTKAAMDAVRTWRYQPYLLNGVATEVETTIYVKFTFEK
jgi:protein TonB